MEAADLTGEHLARTMATLGNPHRLRVIAALAEGRNYVSQLARDLGISRALLQVHLRRLEAVGLVCSTLEVSEDGKAMKFYELTPFELCVTPTMIAKLAPTLGADSTDADPKGDTDAGKS
jgi:DNA-binding transcriptional ArsR family regulator